MKVNPVIHAFLNGKGNRTSDYKSNSRTFTDEVGDVRLVIGDRFVMFIKRDGALYLTEGVYLAQEHEACAVICPALGIEKPHAVIGKRLLETKLCGPLTLAVYRAANPLKEPEP